MKRFLYQFCRLFWSKEMKELVNKYQAEGTLNEEAVQYFNKQTQKTFYLMFILIAFFYFIGEWQFNFFLLFLMFFIPYEQKRNFYRYHTPYAFGKEAKVTIVSTGENLHGGQFIKFKFENDAKYGKLWLHKPLRLKKKICQIKMKIFQYIILLKKIKS